MAPLLSGNDGRLLQHRSFVSFWLARTSSSFGFQMLSIIVGWQIYSQTHSAFWLGMIGWCNFPFRYSRTARRAHCRPV